MLGPWAVAEALAMAGRHDEALAAVEPALGMSGRHPWGLTLLASIHAAMGHRDGADAVYQELASRARTGYIESGALAAAAAAAGRMDEGLAHAAKGVAEREAFFVYWRCPPDWAAFRADPRGERFPLDAVVPAPRRSDEPVAHGGRGG